MLRNRKIAVFMDVDNTEMEFAHYKNAMEQICSMGEIVCATVYGASERKQKGVIDDAKQKGFTIQLPARTRRRVRKVFDERIWVDVTDLVAHNANVDTVAIVAYPTDMVYLFSYLRRLGLQVVGCSNLDEASLALVSDVVEVGGNAEESANAETAKDTAKTQQQEVNSATNEAASMKQKDATSVLSAENTTAETPEESVETAKNTEKPMEQTSNGETPQSFEKATKQTNQFEAIQEMRQAEERTPAATEAKLSDLAANATQSTATTTTTATSTDSADLVDKIDEMSKHNRYDSDDDLVAEIKKLLDGLD